MANDAKPQGCELVGLVRTLAAAGWVADPPGGNQISGDGVVKGVLGGVGLRIIEVRTPTRCRAGKGWGLSRRNETGRNENGT